MNNLPHKKPLYFVGPEPPPTGGVAMMNVSVQRLMNRDYDIQSFNTASGSIREDLYGKKGLREAIAMLRMLFAYLQFLARGEKTVINVFITSGLSFVRDIFFIVFAKLFGYKVIIHLHAKVGSEVFVEGRLLKFFALVVGFADVVFALSQRHKNFFDQYIEPRKIWILENFIFREDFEPIPRRDQLEFLYVGRLTEQKGFYDLLEALAAIRQERDDWVVHVIGVAESPEREAWVNQQVRDKNLTDVVKLHGVQQGVRKYDLFRRCAALIFPSHMENSPVVIKEAMMARQAIIYSDIEENTAIIGSRPLAFSYCCGDAQQLKNKISDVLDNNSEILALSAQLDCPLEFSDFTAAAQMNRAIKSVCK